MNCVLEVLSLHWLKKDVSVLYLSLCRVQPEAERMKVIMVIMGDHGKHQIVWLGPGYEHGDGLHFFFHLFLRPVYVLYFLFLLFLFSVPGFNFGSLLSVFSIFLLSSCLFLFFPCLLSSFLAHFN